MGVEPVALRARMKVLIAAARGGPASAGAHRLGWWIAGHPLPKTASVALARPISEALLERIVLGEVEPEELVRAHFEAITRGLVRCADWDEAGPASWRERPAPRAKAA